MSWIGWRSAGRDNRSISNQAEIDTEIGRSGQTSSAATYWAATPLGLCPPACPEIKLPQQLEIVDAPDAQVIADIWNLAVASLPSRFRNLGRYDCSILLIAQRVCNQEWISSHSFNFLICRVLAITATNHLRNKTRVYIFIQEHRAPYIHACCPLSQIVSVAVGLSRFLKLFVNFYRYLDIPRLTLML